MLRAHSQRNEVKAFRFVVVAVLAIVCLIGGEFNSPISAATPTPIPQGIGWRLTNVPETVTLGTDPAYKNMIGLHTDAWLGEPGVLTGDAGDAQCAANKSCWAISPDTQHKLTNRVSEGINLQEGAFTSFALAKGTFEVQNYKVVVNANPDHMWLVFLTGLLPSEGDDRNLQIKVSGYDAGFALETNLPPGKRVSENYLLANVASAHVQKNCGLSGCNGVSLFLFDVNTGAWAVLSQATLTSKWVLNGTNIRTPEATPAATPDGLKTQTTTTHL